MKPAVVQLIDSFNQGGSERQALQLTRLLSEGSSFKVYLACLNPEGSLRPTVDDLDLGEVPSFPLSSFYDSNALIQLRRFVRWLKSTNVQVIHTHDFYTNVFGMAGAALARVPVRIASMRETAEMRTAAQKQVQRVAYSLAHAVVANSKAVQTALGRDGVNEEKITVIYNGLNVARVSTRASRSESMRLLGLEESTSRRYISIVANMHHEVKDYPMFLRSAKRVAEAIPDAGFLMAGEGELSDGLRELAKELGIEESTYFLGRCEHIAELLSISEACVLSSKAEGFSNSILEYMAAARPVVATDVGGASEVIEEGKTGYLVQPGDDTVMAARLISLLRDSEAAAAMGQMGRRVVEEKFSCEAQLKQTEALYKRLL